MIEQKDNTPLYYPRKMRRGWCVAHEVTAAGVTIERYGIHCQTYAEAYGRAEVMNSKQQSEIENTGTKSGEMAATSGKKGDERL